MAFRVHALIYPFNAMCPATNPSYARVGVGAL